MISNESIRQNGCSNSDRPCQALTGEPAIDAVCCIRSNEPMHYGHAQYLPIAPPLFALLAGALILLLVLAQIRVLRYAYMQLGMSSGTAFFLLFASLIGSYIKIPIAILGQEPLVTEREVTFFGMRYIVRKSALEPQAAGKRRSQHFWDAPPVDGSELARKIFASHHWSVQPCVRPVHGEASSSSAARASCSRRTAGLRWWPPRRWPQRWQHRSSGA